MAGIIHLAAGADPPAGEDWVLITQETAGALARSGSVTHARGWTFHAPPPNDMAETIGAACAWADAHNIGVVYLRSLPASLSEGLATGTSIRRHSA
jgi:hypothetical protein